MAKLIFTEAPFTDRTFEFAHEKTTVGRDARHDLVIHHDSISHNHCEILVHGGEIIVRDLGSKNGTFVDDIRLKNSQAQLKHGQVVRFGSVKARLDLEGDSEDTETSMTAVGLFDKYDAANLKTAPAKQKGDGPEMELGSGDDETDQTVMMPRTKASASDFSVPGADSSDIPGRKQGWKMIVAVVVVVILGMVVFLALRK